MSSIKAICFDLGGTLIDDRSVPATLALADLAGTDLATMRRYLQPSKCVREDPGDLAVRIAADFPQVDECQIRELLARRQIAARHPALFADVMPALRTLRHLGFRLAALSNVLGAIAPPATWNPFAGLVEATLLSCDIGKAKPASLAFDALAATLRIPPSNLAYVGDTVHADIEGAIAAGWHGVHLVRTNHSDSETSRPVTGSSSWPTIHGLEELVEMFTDPIAPPKAVQS